MPVAGSSEDAGELLGKEAAAAEEEEEEGSEGSISSMPALSIDARADCCCCCCDGGGDAVLLSTAAAGAAVDGGVVGFLPRELRRRSSGAGVGIDCDDESSMSSAN